MRILPDEAELLDLAAQLLAGCRGRGLTIVTAESCTGGLLAATLTAIAGSSDVVAGGFVTYSNAFKSRLLGVPAAVIAREGAVSEPVARAMAEGALTHSDADLAVGITGIAGPGGGGPDKPVGLVWIAGLRRNGAPVVHRCVFAGDRQQVRSFSVRTALELLAYCGGVALSSSGMPPIAPP
jgi:nicotinamide-nucleotide amidase